jgi:predicted enzyme related to lactoylglutathione lyase
MILRGFVMQNIGSRKARAVGINHIALEVGDIDAALEFYGRFLDFEIQEQSDTTAFIYFGDQFINFMKHNDRKPDEKRHFGIAVDDKELVRQTLKDMGVNLLDSVFLDFLDPWGNRVEITTYTNIQYTKADHILRGMGLGHLVKTKQATDELRAKGMAPDNNVK